MLYLEEILPLGTPQLVYMVLTKPSPVHYTVVSISHSIEIYFNFHLELDFDFQLFCLAPYIKKM